jgi:hypothetical protein
MITKGFARISPKHLRDHGRGSQAPTEEGAGAELRSGKTGLGPVMIMGEEPGAVS